MRPRSLARAGGSALAAAAALAGLACVAPALVMLGGAFWQDGHPSLAYAAAALADPGRWGTLLANTLAVTGGTTALALALGVPFGFLCFRTDLPGRRAWQLACVLAACLPPYVTATSWMALFGMQAWLYRPWAAAWIGGLAAAPLAALVSGACFALADRDAEDTATLETGRAGVFRHAVLPLAAWGIGLAAVAVAVLTAWDITITDILCVRTFAEEVFTQFQLGRGPQTAVIAALPMMLLVGGLCALAGRALREHGVADAGRACVPAPPLRLGRWRYPLLALVAAGVGMGFVIPFAALVRAVGSFANLATAWRTASPELLGTLRVTPLAATLSTVLAACAAWALVRAPRWRGPLRAGVLLLLCVPAPVVGIGLIELLNRPGLAGRLYDTHLPLVLAYVARTLPFGVLAILPAMRRVPRDLADAVALEGGGWLRELVAVAVPSSWPSLAAAWCLAFILATSELGASVLVVPPGRATLSIRFFTLIHYGVYPDAAGICLILAGLVALAAAGVGVVVWRARP